MKDNVISLPKGHTPANPENTAPNKPKETALLTMQNIHAIGGAYHRLLELKSQSVVTPTTEAEVRGLLEYLANELISHADELIACYVAVKLEYEPMLNIFASVGNRVSGIQHARAQIVKRQTPLTNEGR